MSNGSGEVVSVKILLDEHGNPPGKLAGAEVIFRAGSGPFKGLKLVGFSVWEGRNGQGRNVTVPSRQYSKNGERRSFALLRPHEGPGSVLEALRQFILDEYDKVIEMQDA